MNGSPAEGTDDSQSHLLAAPLCFVHVPKAAGGTLQTVLDRAYGDGMIADAGNWLRGEAKTELKVARLGRAPRPVSAGHVPYAVFRSSFPAGTRFIAMLRAPIERALSQYQRHLRGKVRDGVKLESLAQVFELGLPDVSNLATRFLCDDPHCALSSRSLEEAKRNLEGFAFVGLQERFDESVVLMHRALGLDRLFHYGPLRHVNEARPLFSAAERELVLAHNALDAELYAFAGELFSQALAAAGDVAGDVERLRAMSMPVLAEHDAARRRAAEWLELNLPPGTTKSMTELYAAAAEAGIAKQALREETRRLRDAGAAAVVLCGDGSRLLSTDGRIMALGKASVVQEEEALPLLSAPAQ